MDKKAEAKSRVEQLREQEAQKAASEKPAQQGEGECEDGEGAPAMTEEERRKKRLEDGIGIPHIVVDCGVDRQPTSTVLEWSKLPSVEEVRSYLCTDASD